MAMRKVKVRCDPERRWYLSIRELPASGVLLLSIHCDGRTGKPIYFPNARAAKAYLKLRPELKGPLPHSDQPPAQK